MALVRVLKKLGYIWTGYIDNRTLSVYSNMIICLIEFGVQQLVVTDPAGELKGYGWKYILNNLHAPKGHVETECQHMNYAENTIEIVKLMCEIFHI